MSVWGCACVCVSVWVCSVFVCGVCVCGVCVQYVLFMPFLFFQRYDLMRGTNRYFVVVCLAARMQGRHPSPEA